jgi:hypothetical protein
MVSLKSFDAYQAYLNNGIRPDDRLPPLEVNSVLFLN